MFERANLGVVPRISGGFHPFFSQIKGKVGSFVHGAFGNGTRARILGTNFSDGLPGVPVPRNPEFSPLDQAALRAKGTPPNLESLPSSTDRRIRSLVRAIPLGADYYDASGVYTARIPLHTEIVFDSQGSIYRRYNNATKTDEAFLKTTHRSLGGKAGESFGMLSGFLRATWLDTVVSPTGESTKNPEMKNASSQAPSHAIAKKSPSFDGHIGIDGQLLPAYIVRAVTVNYCNTILVPRKDQALEGTVNDLKISGQKMVAECLEKKISLKDSLMFGDHQKLLKQKTKLEAFDYAIKSFTMNDAPVIDSKAESVLASIQKTRAWQDILTKSSLVVRAAKKKNPVRRKTADGKHTLH